MNDILISYFYQIRFFKPYMIPFSTALSDPKWFHQNHNQSFVFKDKNNVYNGIKATPLIPQMESDGECGGAANCNFSPENCKFLSNYYSQLKSLDFNSIVRRLIELSEKVKSIEGFSETPIPILIVYETPKNPCSERVILRKWFNDNGCELREFDKNLCMAAQQI